MKYIKQNKMWLNKLYCGDNIKMLKNIPPESVDLIYIDPPFFSNKHYEVIWGNGAELRSFGDRWKGGIEHYINWMVSRLKLLHKILKPTGSIYVHLDWHAAHYLKVEMDKIFGLENFRREIIWSNETSSGYKAQANNWIRGHDNILYYTKSGKYTFNKQFLPLESSTIKRYDKTDKGGRKYKIYNAASGTNRKVYLDKSKGRPLTDCWKDIVGFQTINNTGELIGYPTQKPEALLERIIKASSNEGDTVLDAFSGCGTTVAAAHKLNRKWIGIDVSPVAVRVMEKRLHDLGVKDFIIYGIPERTIPMLKNKKLMDGHEFQDWVIEQIQGEPPKRKVHDFGIDGFAPGHVPIEVKQSEHVGREVVDKFKAAIQRESKEQKNGKIYGFSFTPGAYEEAARLLREDKIDIELITIEELLIEKYEAAHPQ